jgi:tetratricopeptide (TPR) repeat protein
MHELVRQYRSRAVGGVRRVPGGPRKLYRLLFSNSLSEAASAGLGGSQPSVWMARVEQEIDNLRAVLQWLIAHRPEDGLQMTLNLFWLWQSTNHLQEGCNWLASALAHTESVSPFLRASAYTDAGFLAICMNRIAEAEELLAHSFALYQTLDTSDPQVAEGLASILNHQSVISLFRGDYAATLRFDSTRRMEMARQSGLSMASRKLPGPCRRGVSIIKVFCPGNRSDITRKDLSAVQAVGNLRSSGRRLTRLGHVACALGDLTEAIPFFHRALQAAVDCRDQAGVCCVLIGLVRTAAAQGDYQRATALLAAKEEIAVFNPIARFWPMERKENEKVLALIHAHLDDAAFAAVRGPQAAQCHWSKPWPTRWLTLRRNEHHRRKQKTHSPSRLRCLHTIDYGRRL